MHFIFVCTGIVLTSDFLYIFRPSEVDPKRIGLINVYMYELATFRVYLTSFLSQYSVPGSILYHTASVGNIHTRRMFGSVCGRRIEAKTHQIIAFSLHLGSSVCTNTAKTDEHMDQFIVGTDDIAVLIHSTSRIAFNP